MITVLPLKPRFPVLLLAVAVCGAGCTTAPPDTSRVLPDAEAAFSVSGRAERPERWWTAFNDEALNGLVDQALASNFNLLSAWERLREARAVARREGGDRFPDLEGFADGQYTSSDGETGERLELGLASSYEVDLWGRIRAGVQADRLRVEATRADVQAAALTVAAEITRSWVQLLEASARLELLREQVGANRDALELLRARFARGQTRRVDVLRQQQLLEATRQQAAAAESRIAVLRHQIAVLTGRPPRAGMDVPARALPEMPPLPETGVPADLIRRRPDVQQTFYRLQAANREVAAAIADRYPRLDLRLSYSTLDDGGAEALFENWALSVLGNLAAPLLDAGRRAAEVERTRAVEQRLLMTYGQTILTAFREVEDALVRERKQLEQVRRLEHQVALAEASYDQLRIEYRNGITDFIDVLSALTDEQQLRRELLTARRVRLEFRIALYRALAGGFGWTAQGDRS